MVRLRKACSFVAAPWSRPSRSHPAEEKRGLEEAATRTVQQIEWGRHHDDAELLLLSFLDTFDTQHAFTTAGNRSYRQQHGRPTDAFPVTSYSLLCRGSSIQIWPRVSWHKIEDLESKARKGGLRCTNIRAIVDASKLSARGCYLGGLVSPA